MTDEVLGQDVQFKLRRLMDDRVARDLAKAEAEAAEKQYRETEAEAWQALEESPLKGVVRVDLGEPYGEVSFQTRETYYGRVIDKEQVLDHFEQRGMIDDVMEPKLSKARINEIVNDCLDAGQSPPEGLDFYARRYMTITRPKD